MTKTYCDICGKEKDEEKGWVSSRKALTSPEERFLPMGKDGILHLCKVEDCCPTCFRYADGVNVQRVLLDRWKELVEQGGQVI